ncbi:SERTA domain-containing protein 3 [Betta splendens]|uniref:SERTA domain-containing protein 3 n=1 Tax=Betta splendens TaxID=158456 RepID=A0A6P7P1R9_BETSP|nr:SERTA domain-containing protein 3 [Betta splendens]XP_029026293.1 SERTA domain-containing protein 3 [Betta splendens]
MIMKGQKRKLLAEDSDPSSPTWESQREFVFSVSLSKYQRGQELPEPSLRRSVLIANTLRQINLEAYRAQSFNQTLQPLCSSSSPLQVTEQDNVFTEVTSVNYHSAVTVINSHPAPNMCPQFSTDSTQLSNIPGFHSSTSHVSVDVVEEDEDWGSMSTDSDFSLSAAISSILTALETTIDGSPPSAQRTPLRSLENLSGSSYGGVAGIKQGVRGSGGSWEQHEFRACESSVEVMRSSYLSDLTMEDLFQDIDTSLLERDTGVLGLRSGDGFPSADDSLCYLPSLSSSLVPPFNQKCLPSFSSFSPLSPSFSSAQFTSSPTSSPFSGPGFVKEGLELDHVMEVLVES